MNVLYGVLLMLGLCVVLGLLLAFAAVFFAVKEDPRIKEVEKLLPNINCGGCGYAGCHDMAEALCTGKEKKVSKCKPGKKDKNFDPIIEDLTAHQPEEGDPVIPTL